MNKNLFRVLETHPDLTVGEYEREPVDGELYSVSLLDTYEKDDPMFYEAVAAQSTARDHSVRHDDIVVVHRWDGATEAELCWVYIDGVAFKRYS